jgi:hypothetical protein
MNIPYSNILIVFQNSIVATQTTYSDDFSKYYMKITSPRDSSPYVGQTLGEDTLVPIPSNGVVKLQLIPSLRYKSKGEYIVKYYKKGNFNNHFREERWVVPPNHPLQTVSYEALPTNNEVKFSFPVFEVLKVEPALPFLVQYDSLIWTQNQPLVGSMVNITYQPAITLDSLVRLGDIRNDGNAMFRNLISY